MPRVEHELIQEELGKILASKPFAAATRSRRFLSYVIAKTLDGEQDGIKELIVGIEVFDRAADFDPRADTIVRVEAGKLRKRLEEYYETDGNASRVRIEIPKGGYVPRFEVQEEPFTRAALIPARVERAHWKYVATGVVLLILAAMVTYWLTRRQAEEPSVAVLPFLNFSSNAANDYLGDGLTEDLTDALVRIGGMRVASRTSAFFFKGKQTDIHDVGTKLHADFVVEGSVRREGERIKITAQLIRTSDGFHIWSNSFERTMGDILEVQQEIAQSVASTLEQRLTRGKSRRPPPHTTNVRAFDLYMRGRHAAAAGILTNIDEPERFFLESSKADPSYALPYVALADLYYHANIMGLRPTRELIGMSKAAVSKALLLDNRIADANAILGSLAARHDFNWVAAEGHFHDALELDPNSASAHNMLAQDVLAPQGRWEEAAAENRKALELDPFSPTIAVGQPWLLYLQRRYKPALNGFKALMATHVAGKAALVGAASALMGQGDYPSAIEMLNQAETHPVPMELAALGYAYARAGEASEARKILDQLATQSRTQFVSPTCFAFVYMGLNDRDYAFDYLDRARLDHESFLIFSRVSEVFDPIRSDPRFAKLLAEIGLDDESVAKNQALARRVYR